MGSDTEELLRSIDKSLKSLLRLKVEEIFEDDATNRDKVKLLYRLGFDNTEMAEIVGTSEGSIRSSLSALRSNEEIE